MFASTIIAVEKEQSAVGAARRAAATLGEISGFDEDAAGRLALVTTELGTNLLKHAPHGVLILRALPPVEGVGVEVLSLDRGPGMQNVAQCLRDGYSTGGTLGTGLGAVMRAASAFDILSDVRTGTAVVARVRPRHAAPPNVCVGAVCLPQAGETACGDGWGVIVSERAVRVVVVDGLGHGPLAAAASDAALRAFYEHPNDDPAAFVQRCHESLRTTRGGVLAVAALDRGTNVVTYCAVGNIAATFLETAQRHGLTSQNGVVGHQLPELRVVTESWPRGGLLVVNSDGLSTRWMLDAYPGILAKHPSIIAGVLYRDFSRGHDDTTVVVLRNADDEPSAGAGVVRGG